MNNGFGNTISGWAPCVTFSMIIFCIINQCQSETMFPNQFMSTEKRTSPPLSFLCSTCLIPVIFMTSSNASYFRGEEYYLFRLLPEFAPMTSSFNSIRFLLELSKMFQSFFEYINHIWTNQFFIQSTDDYSGSICYANDVKNNQYSVGTKEHEHSFFVYQNVLNHWNKSKNWYVVLFGCCFFYLR